MRLTFSLLYFSHLRERECQGYTEVEGKLLIQYNPSFTKILH